MPDFTGKHLSYINWLEINAIPGANIFTIHQFVKENKTRINLFTLLIVHVGTKDIGDGLDREIIEQI